MSDDAPDRRRATQQTAGAAHGAAPASAQRAARDPDASLQAPHVLRLSLHDVKATHAVSVDASQGQHESASYASALDRGGASRTCPSDRPPDARAQRGESTALDELIGLHWPRVYRTLALLLGSGVTAEMVARISAEAAAGALAALPASCAEASFSSRLFRHVVNEARRRAAVPRPVLPARTDERAGESGARELRARLALRVGELPFEERVAVVLRDVEALSTLEAAEAMELTAPEVRALLGRGRRTLMRQVGDVLPVGGEIREAPAVVAGRIGRLPGA